MDTKISLLSIVIIVTSMALTPLIMIQNADAAPSPSYCADQTGKSSAWIQGCKDGWWDHDHCIGKSTYSGDYGKGYEEGWSLGSC
jgi:hypothetical protein